MLHRFEEDVIQLYKVYLWREGLKELLYEDEEVVFEVEIALLEAIVFFVLAHIEFSGVVARHAPHPPASLTFVLQAFENLLNTLIYVL